MAPPSTADPNDWVRVVLDVDPDAVELASDLLFEAGAAGIEERVDGGRVTLLAGFEQRALATTATAQAAAAGFGAGRIIAVTDDGLDAWRAWAEPVLAGTTWITPTWVVAPELSPGQRILWIDPGRTFGSGSHPTTRLVLHLIEQEIEPGQRMLDVGCGSGVLAVGGALLGAKEVIGTDIDPTAAAATEANALRNGVEARVTATDAPLHAINERHQPFDLVAANLLAPVVAELARDLVAAVAPAGRLIVSGVLADRWEASAVLLSPLEVERVAVDQGWAAVVLSRPGEGGR